MVIQMTIDMFQSLDCLPEKCTIEINPQVPSQKAMVMIKNKVPKEMHLC